MIHQICGQRLCIRYHLNVEVVERLLSSRRILFQGLDIAVLKSLHTAFDLFFKLRISLLHNGGERRIVRHNKRLKLAELPVKALVIGLVGTHAEVLRIGTHARIHREIDREISHAHRQIGHFADRARQPWAHLHHMRLIGAEDTHRAVGFVAAKPLGVRIMRLQLSGLKVIAHDGLQVSNGDLLVGRGPYREASAGLHRLLETRRQQFLNLPDARIVVVAVTIIIAAVSLGKIEFSIFLRVVETVLYSEFNERFGSQKVRALRIVLLQTSLVAGSKVLVFRCALSEPLVARARFEVPHFLFIHQHNAETFSGTLGFNDGSEQLHGLASGFSHWQKHVRNVIFGDAGVLNIGINLQSIIARKDRFRSRKTDARFIPARCSVHLSLPIRNRGETHGIFRQRILKIVRSVVIGCSIHAFLPFLGRMNHQMLRFQCAAVSRAGNQD